MGEGVLQAALIGSKEIGFTIISMTLSLAAVFIPVLFMGRIIGRLLHEFAVTISCAILISGFVSLTLTPMLCSRFLRPPSGQRHGRLYAASERFFDGMFRTYAGSLKWVMRHRVTTMVSLGAVIVATGFLFVIVPKGFLPSDDTNQVFAATEAAQGASFEDMARHQQALADIVRQDPNVDSFSSSIGGNAGSLNQGRLFMRLKPRSQRKLSVDEVIQELRPKLASVPGINAYLQNPSPIRIGGQLTKSLYQLTLQSPDTQELYKYAPLLQSRMSELPGCLDGYASDSARLRRRSRIAPPARSGGSRRLAGITAPDAIRHAGLLHLYGHLPNEAWRMQGVSPARARQRSACGPPTSGTVSPRQRLGAALL